MELLEDCTVAEVDLKLYCRLPKRAETTSQLVKERETVKANKEAPPVVKETTVLVPDTKKIDSLTAKLEDMKASLQLEKQRADDSESIYTESEQVSEERKRKLQEAEGKINQLQESVQRLEEKLTNLESENKRHSDSGLVNGESRSIADSLSSASFNMRENSEIEDKPQRSHNDKQENQDLLIRCIAQDLGFIGNSPVAACITYKCLLQWRSFEVERTSIFDRIIQTIGHVIEFQGYTTRRESFFANGSLTSGVDKLRQVEAKYPALLFKQQLTVYVEKIYGIIRDNLKKEIYPQLGLCIQVPRTSRASLVKAPSCSHGGNSSAQRTLIAHWQGIVKSLESFLNTLKTNHIVKISLAILFPLACAKWIDSL
ncbi:hypothetical protein Cni_G16052 [Canna indica]|uniref:Dilute domain-containing protein n=1 Tax=Canna indica TaxID=4628 RepID=A0AAQ3KFL5_9LILI|nr:hypothetical protein Cni_G16052 [Canna indica]